MNRFWGAIAAVFACLAGGTAEAGDAERRAREEVERELAELVNVPRARVRILYQGLDEPQMKLEALELLLDGKPLKVSNLGALDWFGEHVVYRGDLPERRHELITRVVYVDSSSVLISELAGFKWKVSSAVRFETRDGLEVTVRAVPEKVPDEDVRKQLRVKHAMGVAMVAEVDTTVPEPLKRKPVVVAQAEETSPAEAEAEVTEPDDVAAAPAPEREEEGGTSKQAEVAKKTRPGRTRSPNRRKKRPRVAANAARAEARRTNDARGMRTAASLAQGGDGSRGGAADGQRGVVAAARASGAREGGADSRGDGVRGDFGDAEGTGTGAGSAGGGDSATAAGPEVGPADPRAELPEPSAPEGEEAPSTTGAAQARVPAPEALESGGAAEARQASEEATLIPMPVYAGGMVALLLALVGVLMKRRK